MFGYVLMINCSYKNCKKLNNSGFSLVELLITVTILGIASVALMKAFSSAAFTNKNSQKMQNAMSLAESTMEEIKRLNLEQLEAEYGEGSGSFSETLDLADSSVLGDLKDACDSGTEGLIEVVSRDTTEVDKFPYYILYRDEATATQGKKYRVVATIEAKPYGDETSDWADNINAKKLPNIKEINEAEHAVLSSEINQYDASALNDIKSQFGTGKVPADISSNISKTINILIKDGTALDYASESSPGVTPSLTENTINISCQIEYKYSTSANLVTYNVFNGTYSSASGGNVYLFYNFSGFGKDYINIYDESSVVSGVSHDVYIIAQDTSTVKMGTISSPSSDDNFYLKLKNGSVIQNVTMPTGATPYTITSGAGSNARTNTLYTNLYETGWNTSVTPDTTPKGHVYTKDVSKNNIYEIEVSILDIDTNEICASMKSTKSGYIEP